MTSVENFNQMCGILDTTLVCEDCGLGPRVEKYRWFKCMANHLICQSCQEVTIYTCTVQNCGWQLSQDHCKVIEALLQTNGLKFKCSFVKQGCEEKWAKSEMIRHENECIYRLIQCPIMSCKMKIPIKDLTLHLEQNDGFRLFDNLVDIGGNFLVKQSLTQNHFDHGHFSIGPVKILYEGSAFLFQTAQFGGRESIYCWTQLIGSPIEAKNYYYTLEFSGIDPNIRSAYSGQVFSLDEPADNIISSDKCFGINFQMFKAQFMDTETRDFKVLISIKNVRR